MMLPYLALYGVLLGLSFGFELQRLEHMEWFLANQTCSETLSGVLLTPNVPELDKSLEIAMPPTQNYWSSKTATVTDFIQFEGCFNSSVFSRKEPLLPGQHPIAACFEFCENTTRVGLMTKDMMNVDCVCLEQGDLASSRENVSSCYIPCPNDVMMNSCGNDQFMSVYNRQSNSGAPSLNGMAQCIAVTTDDMGTVTLQYDDCQNTNDGYICEICDGDQCLQNVLQDMAITWQEAQEACQKRGGYLGNLGSAKAKTIWTGHKRWLLEDKYSVFGTYCLMCNYTNGTQMRDCGYINCSEELPSLCLKDSGSLPSKSWFEAENFCTSLGSNLMSGEELYEKKVNESIYSSHYYWTNGVANFTPYVRTIGCFDIHNVSGIFPSIHTIQGPGRECVQICQNTDYFGLMNDSMTLQCFCVEHFKNLSQSNATECTMPCTEKHDLCSGENGGLIVYEIDRNAVADSYFESKMECKSLRKIQDFMHMESRDCLENATGYICEICDSEMKNCSQEFYVGEYNWYEAAMECRDKGGNLGNSINYNIMVDGIYWFGGRRWLVEQNTTEGATSSDPDSIACQRCRINNGQLQCNYWRCTESLPGMCVAAEANSSLTTDTTKEETTGALDVTTGSNRNHRNHTMYVHVTVTPTDSIESGKSKPQQENDDMNANVIAIIIVLLIIGGVVVLLVVTKLRKGEKVTSDVTDLIYSKNGPTKFTDLRDSASRPASAQHMPVERQRSFSNPSFMDHDIDILAHNMEHDSHPDTVVLDNERQDG